MTRDYGDGTIRQRADGRWEARLSLGTVNGKRARKSVFGKSKREAILKLQQLKGGREQGLSLTASSQSLDRFLDRWLAAVIVPHKRPRTIREYRHHISRHISPKLGHIALGRLQPADVQALLNGVKREVGPSTAWHCRKDLIAALNQARRWRLVRENVAELTEPVSVPEREPTIFDQRKCLRFLAALREEPLRVLFIVSLTSGMRPGEVLALQWPDIDWETATVTVRRSLEPDATLGPTKSHRSRRPLPLSALAVSALRSLPHRKGLVFATSRGTAYSERNVARSFKRILRKAELPDIRFYDLRHSFASLLESEKVPIKALQELMGHARAETTLRYYTHGSMPAKREAIGVLDRLLTPN